MKPLLATEDLFKHYLNTPPAVNYLILKNRFGLYDATASFMDSQVILFGDIHDKTQMKLMRMMGNVWNEKKGITLFEGVDYKANAHPPDAHMLWGAEDMDLHSKVSEVYSEWDSLRSQHQAGMKIQGLEERMLVLHDLGESLNEQREDRFFLNILDALSFTPDGTYLYAGCAHVESPHLIGHLKLANITYTSYMPQEYLKTEVSEHAANANLRSRIVELIGNKNK